MTMRFISIVSACLCLLMMVSLGWSAPAPKSRPPKQRVILKAHKGMVVMVAFSPNGKILASASSDKTIKLWDVATGRSLATLSGHTASVYALAFSPGGKLLASTSDDLCLRLWDVPGGKSVALLDAHWGGAYNLAFSPDGKTLLTGSLVMRFWDVQRRAIRMKRARPLSDRICDAHHSLIYTAEGKPLCVYWNRDEHTADVWDVEAKKPIRTLRYPVDVSLLMQRVAFSPNHKVLASGWDGLCLWDITTGKRLGAYDRPKDIGALAFSPDGKLLAAGWKRPPRKPGPSEGIVSLLDPTTGKELATLEGHPYGTSWVAFSPDGKTLAVGSGYEIIKLWDISGVRARGK